MKVYLIEEVMREETFLLKQLGALLIISIFIDQASTWVLIVSQDYVGSCAGIHGIGPRLNDGFKINID